MIRNYIVMHCAKPLLLIARRRSFTTAAIGFNRLAFMANRFEVAIGAAFERRIVGQARRRFLRDDDLFRLQNHLFA